MASTRDEAEISRDAATIYDYHRLHHTLSPSDAIFCLCSLDTRVATHAATLFLEHHLAPLLIFSGNVGALTQGRFDSRPEAEVFADIAVGMGVPRDKILVESRSTNTGENVRFTYELLRERGIKVGKMILVQKPYMERRTYATFVKQWPRNDEKNNSGDSERDGANKDGGSDVEIAVTSPDLSFEDYPNEENPRDLVINVMVGDLVRIREYAAKGFQIPQEIPEDVWEAKDRLVKAGYNKHLPS